MCVAVPAVCPDVLEPVCGCDGETYANQCEALRAGVSIDYKGTCPPDPPLCGGIGGLECPGYDQLCKSPTGTCHDPCATGECIHRPLLCIGIYEPVCGCDGQTYENECAALSARVSVLYEGECRSDAP